MKKIFLAVIVILLASSCLSGYEKFQNFDEYSMKGIASEGKLEYPYVAVKEHGDKLTVVIVRKFFYRKKVEYTRRESYWYNYEKIQNEYDEKCQCDTIPIHYHRYIFGDTIITYGYSEYEASKIDDFLFVDTREDRLVFDTKTLSTVGENHTFQELKSYINFYRDSVVDVSDNSRVNYAPFYREKKTSPDDFITLKDN